MNPVHALSGEEISVPKRLHRETNQADVRSRYDMILWSNEGLSPPTIATRAPFSRDTAVRYIRCYETEGLKGLSIKFRPVRPRRVTLEYEAGMLEAVAQEPRSLGMRFPNWSAAKLAEYRARQTGIIVGPRQVENYLKAHGWRLRPPVRTVKHKRDPELVAEKKNGSLN